MEEGQAGEAWRDFQRKGRLFKVQDMSLIWRQKWDLANRTLNIKAGYKNKVVDKLAEEERQHRALC